MCTGTEATKRNGKSGVTSFDQEPSYKERDVTVVLMSPEREAGEMQNSVPNGEVRGSG